MLRWCRKNVRMLIVGCVIGLIFLWSYFILEEPDKFNLPVGNYEPPSERPRFGPGEGGKPHILSKAQETTSEQLLREYGINIACSNEISLNRSIPDLRLEDCKHLNYPDDLPRVSVVVPVNNEAWSTLMRTVYSVINRTPPKLLEEILLVDDFSDNENVKTELMKIPDLFPDKLRLIRNKRREGLIVTKNIGASAARGEVIVFLDAHCEVNVNWLPPLLEPIHQDKTTVTVPIIDIIDKGTFEYRTEYPQNRSVYGYFDWGLDYQEWDMPDRFRKVRKTSTEPYKTPNHCGGLLAVNREFFFALGGYDSGLQIWGGENLDLSFKVWTCGGKLLWVPCSRVGHVFRLAMPYNFEIIVSEKGKGPLLSINNKRVVETWFDSKHKEYFYIRDPLARFVDHGNISAQLDLKKQLHCKSFQWYMDNVPYIPLADLPKNLYWGGIRNMGTNTCIELHRFEYDRIQMQDCNNYGFNQIFRLNIEGQLASEDMCVDADTTVLMIDKCAIERVDGPWKYDETKHALLHRFQSKCISAHLQSFNVGLEVCNEDNVYSQWVFEGIEPWW